MSTYWDVYCRTCDEGGGGLQENHNEEGMLALISAAPAIAALPVGIGLSVDSDFGSHLDLEWFRLHATHDLVPRDEYGRFSGQCAERVMCDHCGTLVRCRRADKHEGDHAPKEDTR